MPDVQPYAGQEIEDLRFTGTEPFASDTLSEMVETHETRCRFIGLPICIPGTDIGRQEGVVSTSMMEEDANRLALFYRQNGFFGTTIDVEVEPIDPDEESGAVQATFSVRRGDPVILDELVVEGVEEALDPDGVPPLPLEVGNRFDLGEFVASADSLRATLLRRGHAFAEVLRSYSVDTIADVASATLAAFPGPVVRVDSIIVRGGEALGRDAVVRQLNFREGDLLRPADLLESQRNLFLLDIVQLAAVTVAPDTLQAVPGDSSRATVLVQVNQGPVHIVDAAAGWGNVSCFRTQASWTSRSLGGGARRLSVSGQVSKIGLGGPRRAQLAEGICRAYEDDPFGNELDYRVAADFTRPFFISPRNHVTVSAFAERLSEPAAFQRQSRGGRLSVARRFANGDVGTLALAAERTRLDASTAIFCLALLVCQREDIQELLTSRWRNGPEATFLRDRTDNQLDPRRGYNLRGSLRWATPLLASDLDFVRGSAQGAAYRELRPGWVLAGQLRVGSFFGTADLAIGEDAAGSDERIIPPDERFYAGGAASVRGYEQNALGPGVWVRNAPEGDAEEPPPPTFVPVGGTSLATASIELRFPSPLLREYLKGAAFVDAGAVGTGAVWDLTSQWRITPGLGVRLDTPVGPVRLDLAYNPYGAPDAPLLELEGGDLTRISDSFTRSQSFLQRLQFHIAVGQAF